MNDLAEFLLARITEDETAARATTPVPGGVWVATRDKHADDDAPLELVSGVGNAPEYYADDPEDYRTNGQIIVSSADWQNEAEANLRHITRHDPACALAECEAKRRIIDEIVEAERASDGPDNIEISSILARDLLRLLALPYADHPDYRDEWRPRP